MTEDMENKLYQLRKFAIMDLERAEDANDEALIDVAVAKYNMLYEVFGILGLDF